jgi:ASC-1-like (ASCH) protein
MERKHIQNIWMEQILLRNKRWEARCNFGIWKNTNVGDTFILTDATREQLVRVVDVKYFGNFGDAWFILGDELIPQCVENVVIKSDADKIYRKYYTDSFVRENGVVAFKLELL